MESRAAQDCGAVGAEYGFLLAVIFLAIIFGVTAFGRAVDLLFRGAVPAV